MIKDVPLSDIVFPSGEMRSQVSMEGLDELSRSIRQLGLMNPISVRPIGDKYELIAGFRRTKACEMAGMLTVPARIFTSTDEIADLQKAHENLFREEVNTLDEGSYFKLMLGKHNWKIADLALAVHKSPGYVSRRVALTESPDDVRDALRDGKINLSVAEELTRIPDVDARRRIMYLVINNGATVDVVRNWRIQYESSVNMTPPPVYAGPDGAGNMPGADPNVPGNLTDFRGPQVALEETVKRYHVCHSCLTKVDEAAAKLLILCPDCNAAIAPYLAGAKGEITK